MQFAQMANAMGVKPIIGVELTLTTGHHITLIAENRIGYSNICRLVTKAHIEAEDRLKPQLDPSVIPAHTKGVICLSGCRKSELATLIEADQMEAARKVAARYRDWFGEENYFIELQQNLVRGDTPRNRALARLAEQTGIGTVATNTSTTTPKSGFSSTMRLLPSSTTARWKRPNLNAGSIGSST